MSHSFFTPYPKYLQIRELLLRRLARDLMPGDRLPTENAWATSLASLAKPSAKPCVVSRRTD